MIKPTQPTIPLIETAAEVSKVQPAIINNLSLEGFKPSDCASSSPIASKFICHLKINNITKPMITGIAIMNSLSALIEAKDPISQYTISGSLSSGSAMNLIADINELKNADIATPDNTKTSIPPALYVLDIRYVVATDIKPNMNANIWVIMFAPLNKIPKAAPKPAPFDTPKRSDETRGFLNIDWKAAPEIARHAPTTIAPMILGSLISKTIVVNVELTSSCGKIGDNIVYTTSTGLIGYLPMRNDAKNKIIGKKIKSMILIISFVSLSIFIDSPL